MAKAFAESAQRGLSVVPRTTLAGTRIVLRPNSTEFAPQLRAAAMESLSTVGRWMSWCHAGLTEDEVLEWYRNCETTWNDGTEYEFSAFARSGEYLGAAGLNQLNRDHRFANLGYWIRESQQRHGYAVEAARLLAEFGFRALQLSRIEIVVAEDNLPSRRAAEKAGAKLEGTLRSRLVIHGISTNAAMYALNPNADP
jgi:ribosomal-protein-serine acetyltransferase